MDYDRDDPRDFGSGRGGHARSEYGAGAHGHRPGEGTYREHRRDGPDRDRDRDRGYRQDPRAGDRGNGSYSDDRGFFERAGDEVRSWFGDDEAERRREADQRYDAQLSRSERYRDAAGRDDHYHSWRRERIAELDRDYDEYRRENAQRFHDEFANWRSERQSQRDSLGQVVEHMDVIGSDGSHVGTVDKIRGDRIVLTKADGDAGGHHHSIPSRWIQSVDTRVTLRKTAGEAKAHWKDEERSGAMFEGGRDRDDWRGDRNLNRSFRGTY